MVIIKNCWPLISAHETVFDGFMVTGNELVFKVNNGLETLDRVENIAKQYGILEITECDLVFNNVKRFILESSEYTLGDNSISSFTGEKEVIDFKIKNEPASNVYYIGSGWSFKLAYMEVEIFADSFELHLPSLPHEVITIDVS